MGRLVRTQKVGEGMRIQGAGRLIDLTILDIREGKCHKEVELEIKGIRGLGKIELSGNGRLVELIKDISVGVGAAHGCDLNMAAMVYQAPEEYEFNRKEFGCNGEYKPYH